MDTTLSKSQSKHTSNCIEVFGIFNFPSPKKGRGHSRRLNSKVGGSQKKSWGKQSRGAVSVYWCRPLWKRWTRNGWFMKLKWGVIWYNTSWFYYKQPNKVASQPGFFCLKNRNVRRQQVQLTNLLSGFVCSLILSAQMIVRGVFTCCGDSVRFF